MMAKEPITVSCDQDFLLKKKLLLALASCKHPPTCSLIMFYSTSVIMTEMSNNKIPIKSLNYVKSVKSIMCKCVWIPNVGNT